MEMQIRELVPKAAGEMQCNTMQWNGIHTLAIHRDASDEEESSSEENLFDFCI